MIERPEEQPKTNRKIEKTGKVKTLVLTLQLLEDKWLFFFNIRFVKNISL